MHVAGHDHPAGRLMTRQRVASLLLIVVGTAIIVISTTGLILDKPLPMPAFIAAFLLVVVLALAAYVPGRRR